MSPQMPNRKARSYYMLIATLLVAVVVTVFMAFDMQKVKTFISQSGVWGILIAILCYGLLGFTIIPSEPITLLIGAMFGPWVATAVAAVGNTLAAVAEYIMGQRLGDATNYQAWLDRLPPKLRNMKFDSPLFLILSRLVPGIGTKVFSMLCGVLGVPLLRYAWTTAIPTLFGAILVAFGGFGLGKLFHL